MTITKSGHYCHIKVALNVAVLMSYKPIPVEFKLQRKKRGVFWL